MLFPHNSAMKNQSNKRILGKVRQSGTPLRLTGCVRCGVRMQVTNGADGERICLKCFYEALNERLRSQRRARMGDRVSDR